MLLTVSNSTGLYVHLDETLGCLSKQSLLVLEMQWAGPGCIQSQIQLEKRSSGQCSSFLTSCWELWAQADEEGMGVESGDLCCIWAGLLKNLMLYLEKWYFCALFIGLLLSLEFELKDFSIITCSALVFTTVFLVRMKNSLTVDTLCYQTAVLQFHIFCGRLLPAALRCATSATAAVALTVATLGAMVVIGTSAEFCSTMLLSVVLRPLPNALAGVWGWWARFSLNDALWAIMISSWFDVWWDKPCPGRCSLCSSAVAIGWSFWQ